MANPKPKSRPQSLRPSLRRRLAKAEAVAFLAVGSEFRGDDAAGLLLASQLEKTLKASPVRAKTAVFVGETAPENLTGEIKRFKPTHLVILDAADVGKEAGHLSLIEPETLTNNPSISTHTLPLSVMVAYLRTFITCDAFILGIQPATHGFGKPPSKAVLKAVDEACGMIVSALA